MTAFMLDELQPFEDDGDDDNAITMYDDKGNEIPFEVLSSKEVDGCVYLLAAEVLPEDAADEDVEVVQFKCVSTDGEEMVFEVVDDTHEEYEQVFALFKEDYDSLGIIIDGE